VAFVVSAGAMGSVDRANVPRRIQSVQISPETYHDYATIWRTQPQIRTVVSFLARNIAQLGVQVFRRVSDADRERLTEHPLAELLSQPSPYSTRYRTIEALVSDLGIYDNAFWLKFNGPDKKPALLRLDPTKIIPIGDNPFYAEAYEFRGAKGRKILPADQVVHFHGYNPTDMRYGSSPIETLRSLLAEEWQAGEYRRQLWSNGARISGYIKRPVEAGSWSREARDNFRLQWQQQYTGDGPQTGGTPILEDGMEFSTAAVTPEQAQYMENRKLTREEVAAAYHIPASMVGILEHATYSNIKEQHKFLYMDCLGPWLQMIAEEIELQLVPDFSDVDKIYVEFNLAEKLRGSFEDQATQLQTAIGAPYMTRNEGRAKLNLKQLEGGDELITPLNVLVGGQASPTDANPANADPGGVPNGADQPPADAPPKSIQLKARADERHVEKAAEVLSGYFARQGQVISSKLGATKWRRKAALTDVYDAPRWIAELAAELFKLALGITASAGRATLKDAGLDPEGYDQERTLGWLKSHSELVAQNIEGATADALVQVLSKDDAAKAVLDLFAQYATSRADALATSEVTGLSGFATSEAVEKSGREATKTWRVLSSNPRASHALLDGETVPMEQAFSNGAKFPGDRVLPEGERIGCRCEMTVNLV